MWEGAGLYLETYHRTHVASGCHSGQHEYKLSVNRAWIEERKMEER